MSRPTIAAIAVAVAAVRLAGAAELPKGEPLAVEAIAMVAVDTEAAISLVGIHGDIAISTRDEREVRIQSHAAGPQGAELPVGVWQEGSKLIIAPPPGDAGSPRVVRIEVPKSFAVAVAAEGSNVTLEWVSGGIDLDGKDVTAVVRAGGGSLDAQLEGGSLSVRELADAHIRTHGTSVDVGSMSGDVNVRATGRDVALREIRGSLDVDADDATILIEGIQGELHLKARHGSVSAKGIRSGAELECSGSPLKLEDGRGDITVTSDQSVEFSSMAAAMHLDMYGGSLRGKGNDGILEVRTRNTEVNVETIEDGMRIQGDGLKARLVDIGGELYVETTISDVFVDRAGSVDLHLDRGSVTIQRAGGAVQAVVVGADARIVDGVGPITLDIDGGDAEVSWASVSGDKDSQIVNKSGNVTVRLPVAGACRVEAKSQYGRVDSDLPTVRVLDDLTEAQGPVNGGYRPLIRIVANGDIHLLDGSKSRDER